MSSLDSQHEEDTLEEVVSKYVILEQHSDEGIVYFTGHCPFHKNDGEGNPFPLYIDASRQTFNCLKRGCIAYRKRPNPPYGIEQFRIFVEQNNIQPLSNVQTPTKIVKNDRMISSFEEIGELKSEEIIVRVSKNSQFEAEYNNQLSLFNSNSDISSRISFSMLENYQLCPLKYKHIYIDKENVELVSDNRRIGTSVHNTLKEFYSLPVEDRTTDRLSVLFKKNWSILQLDNLRWFEEVYSYLIYLVSERSDSVPIRLEAGFNYLKEDIVLFGRVDRIDRYSDGSYEVIDYKVLKHDPQDSIDASHLLQSIFLYYGTYDIVGNFPSKITYLHVQNGQRVSFQPEQEFMQLRFIEMRQLVEKITHSKKFMATKNQYCSACKLFGRCPATKAEIV